MDWGMPAPREQFAAINSAKQNATELYDTLEALCTCLVMGIEDYVVRFDAVAGFQGLLGLVPQNFLDAASNTSQLPSAKKVPNPASVLCDNGDSVVVLLRCIGNIMELVPNSSGATITYLQHLVSLLNYSFVMGSNLQYKQSNVLLLADEALKILSFLAVEDSGNVAYKAGILPKALLVLTWGDARLTKRIFQTLSLVCQRLTLTAADFPQTPSTNDGGKKDKKSGKDSVSGNSSFASALGPAVPPHLSQVLNVVQAAQNIISMRGGGPDSISASDWDAIDSAASSLASIALRFEAKGEYEMVRATVTSDIVSHLAGMAQRSDNSGRRLALMSVLASFCHCAPSVVRRVLIAEGDSVGAKNPFFALFKELLVAPEGGSVSHWLDTPFARQAKQRPETNNNGSSTTSNTAQTDLLVATALQLLTECLPPVTSAGSSILVGGPQTSTKKKNKKDKGGDQSVASAVVDDQSAGAPFGVSFPPPAASLILPRTWQWEDDLHLFTPYPSQECLALEAALLSNRVPKVVVRSGGRNYEIDLTGLKQHREGGGVNRNVRRSAIPSYFSVVAASHRYSFQPAEKADLEASMLGAVDSKGQTVGAGVANSDANSTSTSSKLPSSSFFSFATSSTSSPVVAHQQIGAANTASPLPFFIEVLSFLQRYGHQLATYSHFASSPTFRVSSLQALMQGLHWASVGLRWAHSQHHSTTSASTSNLHHSPTPTSFILETEAWLGDSLVSICDSVAEVVAAAGISGAAGHINPTSPTGPDVPPSATAASASTTSVTVSQQRYTVSYALAALDRLMAIFTSSLPPQQQPQTAAVQPQGGRADKKSAAKDKQKAPPTTTYVSSGKGNTITQTVTTVTTSYHLATNSKAVPSTIMSALIRNGVSLDALQRDPAGASLHASLVKHSISGTEDGANTDERGAAAAPQRLTQRRALLLKETRSPAFVKLLDAIELFCDWRSTPKLVPSVGLSPADAKSRFAGLLEAIAETCRDISPFEFTSLRVADAMLIFLDDVEMPNSGPLSAERRSELISTRDDAFAAALADHPAAAETLTKLLVSTLPFVDDYILVESLSSSDEVVCRGVRESILALSNISPRLSVCTQTAEGKAASNDNDDADDVDDFQCPNGHILEPRTSATGWSCDECGHHSRGIDSLRCNECDYDLCQGCQEATLDDVAADGDGGRKQKAVRAHMMSTIGDIEAYFCGRRDPGSVLADGMRTSFRRLLDTAAHLRRREEPSAPAQQQSKKDKKKGKKGGAQEAHADPNNDNALINALDERLNAIGPKRSAHVSLASGRLSLYYEGIGRCSYQETLYGMLYRKSFNRRLFPLVDLFENAIVRPTEAALAKREANAAAAAVAAKQRALQQQQRQNSSNSAPPTSKGLRTESSSRAGKKGKQTSSGQPKKNQSNDNVATSSANNDDDDNANSLTTPRAGGGDPEMGEKAMTPCSPIGMGQGGEGGVDAKHLANRQRALSFSAVPPRRALFNDQHSAASAEVAHPDASQAGTKAAHAASGIAMRDRVLCFHYFPSDSQAAAEESTAEDRCACGSYGKDGMIADEQNQSQKLQLKPPAIEGRPEIVLLQFLFETNKNASLSSVNKQSPHLINEQSFISRSMTDRIVKSFSASALRVALLDPQFAIPRWAYYLLTEAAFLFTAEVRRQLAAFLAFGARRRLWEFMHSEGLSAPGMIVYPSEWVRIPTLSASASMNRALGASASAQRTNRQVVDRTTLLADAYRLVRDTAELRFPLSIEFKNEKGTGNGPTVAFFANVAKELCKAHLGIWRDNTDHGRSKQPNEGEEDDNATSKGGSPTTNDQDNSFIVVGKEGLFPAIGNPSTSLSEDLFYVAGGVMARAYMDNKLFPLELSPALLAYLRFGLPKRDTKAEAKLQSEYQDRARQGAACATAGGSTTSSSSVITFASESAPQTHLDPIGAANQRLSRLAMTPWQHRSIGLRTLSYIDSPLHDSMRKLRAMYATFLAATDASAKADAELSIEALDIAFTLPGHDDILLCKDGDVRTVHVDNITEYLSLVSMAMCYGTVSPQIDSFIKGFTDVVPIAALRLLSGKEISQMVCGADAADEPLWDEAVFKSILQPDHGYTNDSKQVLWLVKLVGATFTPAQQRQFLEFCTGCPRVPIGGITQIGKIRVVYKEPSTLTASTTSANAEGSTTAVANASTSTTTDADSTLVSVNTCFLYLKVPAYSSMEVLSQKLLLSITGSEGFDFS